MNESTETIKGPLHIWAREDWQGQRRCTKCGAVSGGGSARLCPETWRKKKVAAPGAGDYRQGRMF